MNIKQKLFCDLYTDPTNKEYFGNGTKCYQEIYNCNYDTAKNNASVILAKDYIKDYMNNKNKSIVEILAENSQKIMEKAINEANKGNTAILNKLLDKIVPTLNANDNTNTELNVDDYLNNIVNKYVNKAERSQSTNVPQDDKPVSVDNKTS